MRSQAGASRLDTVLKLLLVAFISLLAFSSGVYFGKQMSDSDHQLKALENGAGKTGDETSAEVAKSLDQKPGEAVTDEDVTTASAKYMGDSAEKTAEASKPETKGEEKAGEKAAKAETKNSSSSNDEEVVVETKKSPAKQAAAALAAKAPARATASAEAGKPDLTEAKKTTERIVQNTKPAAPEVREPSSIPAKAINAEMGTPQYTVQVASYPTETDAKKQAAELVKKGFPAYPVEASVKGKTWYRVGVGSFKTQKEASDYRAQLLKQANLTAAIVQKVER